jgi:hypothetical protein
VELAYLARVLTDLAGHLERVAAAAGAVGHLEQQGTQTPAATPVNTAVVRASPQISLEPNKLVPSVSSGPEPLDNSHRQILEMCK